MATLTEGSSIFIYSPRFGDGTEGPHKDRNPHGVCVEGIGCSSYLTVLFLLFDGRRCSFIMYHRSTCIYNITRLHQMPDSKPSGISPTRTAHGRHTHTQRHTRVCTRTHSYGSKPKHFCSNIDLQQFSHTYGIHLQTQLMPESAGLQ